MKFAEISKLKFLRPYPGVSASGCGRRSRVATAARRWTLGAAHRPPVPEPAVTEPRARRRRHRRAHRPVLAAGCHHGPTSGRR